MKPTTPLSATTVASPARLSRATLMLAALLLAAGAARAGSVTAESVLDSNDARQRALELVPRGATVTRNHCQDFEVGGFNSRYRCTVFFNDSSP
jgi:hypothetical protein